MSEPFAGPRRAWERWLPLAGVAAVVLWVTAVIVQGESPDAFEASAREWVTYVGDDDGSNFGLAQTATRTFSEQARLDGMFFKECDQRRGIGSRERHFPIGIEEYDAQPRDAGVFRQRRCPQLGAEERLVGYNALLDGNLLHGKPCARDGIREGGPCVARIAGVTDFIVGAGIRVWRIGLSYQRVLRTAEFVGGRSQRYSAISVGWMNPDE